MAWLWSQSHRADQVNSDLALLTGSGYSAAYGLNPTVLIRSIPTFAWKCPWTDPQKSQSHRADQVNSDDSMCRICVQGSDCLNPTVLIRSIPTERWVRLYTSDSVGLNPTVLIRSIPTEFQASKASACLTSQSHRADQVNSDGLPPRSGGPRLRRLNPTVLIRSIPTGPAGKRPA